MALNADALKRRVNQYDMRRQQLQADSAERRQEATRQAGAQATESGFGKGSGLHEALQRKADVQERKMLGSRMGQVDVAEMQAQEAKDESQKGRDFQKELATMNLDQRKAEAAQQATQFNDRMTFDKWATEQGFEENEANRIWQAAENFKGRSFATTEREAAQGFQQQYGKEMAAVNMLNNITLQNLSNTLATGRMNLQNQLAIDAEERGLKMDSAYKAGLAGQPAAPGWTSAQRAAYDAGVSGKSIQDAEKDYDRQMQIENTTIMSIDPTSEDFLSNLRTLLGDFGYDVPEFTIAGDAGEGGALDVLDDPAPMGREPRVKMSGGVKYRWNGEQWVREA